jgi:hypothetical protein
MTTKSPDLSETYIRAKELMYGTVRRLDVRKLRVRPRRRCLILPIFGSATGC